MADHQVPECCKMLSEDLQVDDPELILKKDLSECMHEFEQAVISLMNGKGGYLLIHAENPRCLEGFDQKVDNYLKRLIPEGSFYHDHYRRYITDDGKHVVFRVKTRPGNRPLICKNWNNRVPLNKGTEEITQAQLQTILQRSSQAPTRNITDDVNRRDKFMAKLTEGEEIMNGKVPFQEDLCTQAKSRKLCNDGFNAAPQSQSLVDRLCTIKAKAKGNELLHYISAFSKLTEGGSVYLGVDEIKKEKKFRSYGLKFTQDQEKEIEQLLFQRVKESMLWVGTSPQTNPIAVKLHKVNPKEAAETQGPQQLSGKQRKKQERIDRAKKYQEEQLQNQQQGLPQDEREEDHGTATPDYTTTGQNELAEQPVLYILEIRIHYYQHGTVFIKKEGPEIYTYDEDKGTPCKVSVEEWMRALNPLVRTQDCLQE